MHTLPALAGSAPLLTGTAILALALALGACGAPRRVELATAPISLPSVSMMATHTPAASATRSPHPAASRSSGTAGSAPPPITTVTGRPASPAAALPLVDASCGDQPSTLAPKAILLACADGSLRLENITYSSYRAASASGHAVLHANTCRPNCANGAYRNYPATMVLDKVVSGQFTRVTLHYTGPGPDGRTTASYPIQ